MAAIHIHKRIESETLHLPELRPLLGRTVEIIILDNAAQTVAAPAQWLPGFWEQISQGWQGEPLVRPKQGEPETRNPLQ